MRGDNSARSAAGIAGRHDLQPSLDVPAFGVAQHDAILNPRRARNRDGAFALIVDVVAKLKVHRHG